MNLKKALNILIVSLLSITISAQNDTKAIEIQDKIWNKSGTEFKNISVPEEWKNESAVILFQDYQYLFDRQGKGLTSEICYHSRVALLDKAAVKEYSKFSFSERFSGTANHRYYRGTTYTGFKIIKTDGTESIVDIETAVPVKTENARSSIKKIAIPDLQEGDIIDYYYYEVENTTTSKGHYSFAPILTTLGTSSPVVYLRREFEVEKNFYINYLPLNGAPEIVEKNKEKSKVFTIDAHNIDKIERADWSYPYRSLPTVKFQVMFAKSQKMLSELDGFAGEAGVIKSNLDIAEIRNFGKGFISDISNINIQGLAEYVSDNNMQLSELSDRGKAKQVYYYLYHLAIRERLEKYKLGIAEDERPGLNDEYFVKNMSAFFKTLGLKGEFLLTVDRKYGSLEDVLLKKEFGVIVRWVGDYNKDMYFCNFNKNPHPNVIPAKYEGSKAYIFPFKGNMKSEKETLPVSHYKNNRTTVTSQFNLDENMEKLHLHCKTRSVGHERDWYQNQLLKMYDYLIVENKKMGIVPIVSITKEKNKKELQEKISEYKSKDEKRRMEALEYLVKHEFNVTAPELSNFRINKNGRFDETAFEFEYNASFEGLIQQAGANYLLNAGLLIGKQIEIEEKNMTRKEDIYMKNTRSYISYVSFSIPEGYALEGIDKLTFNVKNETGGFTSSASMEDNILKIKTHKWYTNNFEKAENWSKMLEFLEAAYEFTGVKVLLKKQ